MARRCGISNAFRIGLAKSLERATGPRNDELRVLATALWFEGVRRALRLPTPYAVEHHFAPRAFRRNAYGDRNHDNNWSKYAIGARCPTPKLVARVENEIPGSGQLLKHPLWSLLRSPGMEARTRKKHLRSLAMEVQRIAFSRRPGTKAVVTNRQLAMLERRAGIDALAALVALMYQAREQGRQDVALQVGDYVYNVLLITCMFPPFRHIARELFDCFQRRVFDAVEDDGEKIYVPTVDCELAIELLSLATRQVRNARDFGYQREDYVRVCVDLLGTKYGFGARCALASPRILAREDVGQDRKDRIESQERNRIWGVANLLGLRAEKFPPRSGLADDLPGQWEPDSELVESLTEALSLFRSTFS